MCQVYGPQTLNIGKMLTRTHPNSFNALFTILPDVFTYSINTSKRGELMMYFV